MMAAVPDVLATLTARLTAMFDAVAPHQDEPATAIDRQRVDQRQARRPASRKPAKRPSAVAPDKPNHRADDDEDEDKRQNELDNHRSAFAEQRFKHRTHVPFLPPSSPERTVAARPWPAIASNSRQIANCADSTE